MSNVYWSKAKEIVSKSLGVAILYMALTAGKIWIATKVILTTALIVLTILSSSFFYSSYLGQIGQLRQAYAQLQSQYSNVNNKTLQLKSELKSLKNSNVDNLLIKYFGPEIPDPAQGGAK